MSCDDGHVLLYPSCVLIVIELSKHVLSMALTCLPPHFRRRVMRELLVSIQAGVATP